MKITFACPSCGATGSADASIAGRQVRCRHCQHRFLVPAAGEPVAEGYGLDQAAPKPVRSSGPSGDAVFVPSRGDEPVVALSPRKPKPTKSRSTSKKSRGDEPGFPWSTWLIRLGIIAAVVLAAIALFAPRGLVIAGWVLVMVGMVMVIVGYGAGAYGAFSEDFLYGFLYLVLPLYNAYYLVTRWDDLWRWFLCSTAGVGFVVFGTRMLEWGGVVE